ncbi:MAG TPA: hypothetical protein VMH27_10780 [Puia sp.]|nr:hypothetical protein [Puia sp.]
MQRCIGAVGDIKSQARFAVVGVRAVAFEAPVGKDRADVEVETNVCLFVLLAVEAGGKSKDAREDQG